MPPDSPHWPTVLLIGANLLALAATRQAAWKISLLNLPGTLAHELSHLIVGLLLLARPSSLSIWPRRDGDRYILGRVSFRGVGLLNGIFVALAPFLLVFPAYGSYLIAVEAWAQTPWSWLLWGTLAANLAYAAFPSAADLRCGLPSIAFYTFIGALAWWLSHFF